MRPVAWLRSIVWNGEERRPRLPIRVVLAIVVFGLLGIGTALGVGRLPVSAPSGTAALVVSGLGSLAIVVVGCVIIARTIDRRRFGDYGLRIDRAWWIDCGFGLVLGALLQTAIFLVGWAAGWYVPRGTFVSTGGFAGAFASVLVLFLAVGIYEELLIRGWLLTNLVEGLRFVGERVAVGLAVAVSSGVFGVLHAMNPNATSLSTAIIGLAGVFLALGYVLTGELAIPIGVHVTWNFTQGAVFGFGVSGLSVPATVIETQVAGPTFLSGGQFGPEGGLLGLCGVLVGCVAIAWWVKQRTGVLRIHPTVLAPELVTGRSDADRNESDETESNSESDKTESDETDKTESDETEADKTESNETEEV
ncbi:type II CAAX prenyl endopeptidase Rce1 family protein [Halopenitus sp. H-Gu1]|uniref:CPBP family intramembrane glutamic endopeptidase n=1 Tax=Halopenitus sp. H-Gu1 TaxID=3242697 RepID=UPI00359D4643